MLATSPFVARVRAMHLTSHSMDWMRGNQEWTIPEKRLSATPIVVTWWTSVALILTACTTPRSPSSPNASQAKVDLARLDPGLIVITSNTNSAAINVDPPNRRMESVSEGAEDATRTFLTTPNLGQPQLEAGVGVLQFALAPFAAAYGAISASQQRVSPAKAFEAQQTLAETIKSCAGPEALVQSLGEAARQRTRRLLLCTNSSNILANGVPVSAVLEVSVEYFRLNVTKSGGNEFILSLGASARLLRAADKRVLLQRSYHYESGPALFIDWTRYAGVDAVAQTGYRALAEQIADDIFQPASEPPILIGPEQTRSSASLRPLFSYMSRRAPCSDGSVRCIGIEEVRAVAIGQDNHSVRLSIPQPRISKQAGNWHHVHMRRLCGGVSKDAPSVQFVSFLQDDVPSMEIHTGKADERLHIPNAVQESGSSSGPMSDTKWSMDGLEHDRNFVVQGMSCLAAVPMGLWEQTVGVVRNRSRDKTDQLARALNAVTTQGQFEGNLADEVARCLQSQVVAPVRRTDEPMRFALSNLAETRGKGATEDGASTKSKTALEIQVVNTTLVGKHPNSRSRAVIVEVQATVFRTSDGQELYSRPIRYRSSEKKLKDWAASDSKLFRQELDACSRRTAQALASDLIARGFVTPLRGINSATADRHN
jgi:hypothetical protein